MSIIPITLTANNRVITASFTIVPLKDYLFAVENISQILHPGEMAYFYSLKHERRQKSYLMGRYASKKVLSSYLNESNLTAIEIVQGIFGQPIVCYLSREMPGISLSHDNSVAVAIAFYKQSARKALLCPANATRNLRRVWSLYRSGLGMPKFPSRGPYRYKRSYGRHVP